MRQAIFATVVAALAACSTAKPASPGQEKAVFQDVPAPPGMAYDAGYGHATSAGHLRSYTQEYSGKKRPDELAKWYRETLPIHGWQASGEDGMKLTFLKKEEQCVVHVASTADGAKVTIRIGYKN